MIDPIRGQIDPSAVPAQFDPLFDHFLPIDLKLHLSSGGLLGGRFIILVLGLFVVGHLDTPFANV